MSQPVSQARRPRIVEVHRGGPLIDAVYAEILRPSFPPDELITLADLRAAVTAGNAGLIVALDRLGSPVGVAVGEWFADGRVVMLAYLAARPGTRGQGIGGALLTAAVRAWSERHRPCLILAELERPDRHRASLAHGDPADRLRFYHRYGATALDLPYFQPALSADTDRAHGMLLIAVYLADDYRVDDTHVCAAPVRRFWTEYLAQTEGTPPPVDPTLDRLVTALHRHDSLTLHPLPEYHRIPSTT